MHALCLIILTADDGARLPENCAVFARMAKDFGDGVLPIQPGQYLPASEAPAFQVAQWDSLTQVMVHTLSTCVNEKGQPGWSARVGDIVVFFVPTNSEFRKRWWSEVTEIGATNSSGVLTSL